METISTSKFILDHYSLLHKLHFVFRFITKYFGKFNRESMNRVEYTFGEF